MPRDARRDIFADAKVILRCRAVILYSPSKLSEGQYHSRSEYHPATPDITAEGNITRRKANITEKALAKASAFSSDLKMRFWSSLSALHAVLTFSVM